MERNKNIVVAGHRGYKMKYPENTLVSFKKALDAGVDMIEFDINLSRDKKLIIMHDDKVDRTTNGEGYIRDLTVNEIKELDAGAWFSEEFAGEKVPVLEELLELVSDRKELLFNVEIKEKTYETVDLTVKALMNAGVVDRCVIASFDAAIIKYANQRYGVRCQGFPGFLMQNFEEGEKGSYSYMYSVGINIKYLSRTMVEFFENMGVLPWAYCVDDRETTQRIIDLGITLITCDDPIPPLTLLREKGYHK